MTVSRRQPKVTDWQNVNKASTGLRTIAARLRRSETDLDELGETVTTAKYQQMVDMLTKHSVSLVDQNGELRDTYSIIQDIAGAWDGMTKNEQAALAEMAAGTRQQNIFTSLILNFKEAEGAMDAMASSSGALTTAYDVYLDSIQAHTGMFQASLQELGQTLFDTGMITDAIDAASDLVEALNPVAITIDKIMSSLGGAKGILTLIAGGVIVKNIGAIAASIMKIGSAVDMISVGNFAGLFSKLAVQGADGSTLISGGAVAGLGAATIAITAIVAAIEAYKKKQEEIRKSTEETADLETKRLDNLQKITQRYSELKSKPYLSEDEVSELQSMQAEVEASYGRINSLIGEQAGKIDLVNGEYREQLGILESIVARQASFAIERKRSAVDYALDDYDNAYNESRFFSDDSVKEMNGVAEAISAIYKATGRTDTRFGNDLERWLVYNTHNATEMRDVISDIIKDFSNSDDWQATADKLFGHNHAEVMSSLIAMFDHYDDAVEKANKSIMDLADLSLSAVIPANKIVDIGSFNDYRNELISTLLHDDTISDAWKEGIISSTDLASSVDSVLASIAPDQFKAYQDSLKTGTEATMKEIVNTLPTMVGKSGMLEGIDEVTGNITKLYGWLDKINSGDFSTSDLFEMLDEFPSLQDAANGVNDLSTDLWKLADAVQGAINAAPDDLISRIDTYMDNHILSANVKAQLDTWKEYLRGMTDLTNVTLPEKVAKIQEMQSAIYDAAGDTSGVTLDQYNSLIKLNAQFADAVTLTGNRVVVDTERAMEIVRSMGAEYVEAINKQIAADKQRLEAINAIEKANGELTSAEAAERASLQMNIQRYQTLQGEILNTLSAYEKWRSAQNTANAGSEISDLEAALEHIDKVTNAKDKDAIFGQWNTDDFRAALALLGKDIDDFMNGGTLDLSAVQEWAAGIGKYFTEGQEGIANFLRALEENDLATIVDNVFSLNEGLTLDDVASKMGMSADVVQTLLEFATRYGLELELVANNAEDAANAIGDVTAAEGAHSSTLASMDALGAVSEENAEVAKLIGLYRDLEDARDRGDQTDQQEFTAQINAAMSEPLDMDSVNAMREAINNVIQSLEAEKAAQIAIDPTIDTSELDAQIASYTKDLDNIEAFVDVKVNQEAEAEMDSLQTTAQILANAFKEALFSEETTINIDYSSVTSATSAVTKLGEAADKLDKTHYINVVTKTGGLFNGAAGGGIGSIVGKLFGGQKPAGAYGGAFAGGTEALVGELGEEMVVDPANRYWYTVGKNGPEFVRLPKHAIVFNHEQTRSLLSRGKTDGRGTAYASGTAASSLSDYINKVKDTVIKKATGNLSTLFDGVSGKVGSKKSSGNNGGGGKSSSTKSSSDKDNWFIKQYKENNHLVEMDKKSQADYLKWLDAAYKKAYKERIIDLDEYRKYQIHNGTRIV